MSSEKNYTIDVLKKLVNIPSINPPGKETRIAEYIAGLLKEIEIPSRVDNIKESRANVTGFLNGPDDGPVLVLNGHLDTVPVKEGWNHDPFAGEISGNKIFGLGTSDMKGAIASMICAAKKIKESKVKLKGSLILSFVADEERNNAGTILFLKKHKNIDYTVIGEPSNLDIVISNRGVVRFEINTSGTAGHASNPANGTNAIYKMNKVLGRIIELADSYGSNRNNYSDRPSLSVTMINGGTAENIIPDRCEIIIDRRTVYGESTADVKKEITALLKDIEKNDETFKYSCEISEELSSWKAEDNSRLLKYAFRVYQERFHKKPELTDLGATCEAALFAERGIDTLVFGPGNIKQAHTKDEFVEISQLKEAAEYYYMLIREILT